MDFNKKKQDIPKSIPSYVPSISSQFLQLITYPILIRKVQSQLQLGPTPLNAVTQSLLPLLPILVIPQVLYSNLYENLGFYLKADIEKTGIYRNLFSHTFATSFLTTIIHPFEQMSYNILFQKKSPLFRGVHTNSTLAVITQANLILAEGQKFEYFQLAFSLPFLSILDRIKVQQMINGQTIKQILIHWKDEGAKEIARGAQWYILRMSIILSVGKLMRQQERQFFLKNKF